MHTVDFSEDKQIKLIVLLSDFHNDEFLADVLLVIPHRLPVRRLEMGELAVFVWRNGKDL